MRIPLIGSSYSAFSLPAAAQQSLNCYLESIEAGGEKNKAILRGIPGIHLFKDLTVINGSATPNRGLWSGGGRLFVAAGTKEFEVDSSGALVGSVNTISNSASQGITDSPVQFFPNGNQLLIVSGGLAYCDNGAGPVQITLPSLSGQAVSFPTGGINYLSWNANPNSSTGNTDTFDVGMVGATITYNGSPYVVAAVISPQLITLATSPGIHSNLDWSCTPSMGAVTGTFLDGYFIVQRPNSRQFSISPLNNGMGAAGDGKWSALDYDIKSGWPDNLQAIWSENELLYLFGTESSEAWRNTGNADFPFQRVDGGFLRIGLAATWSLASIAGKVYFLGSSRDGAVKAYRLDGGNPVPVSHYGVEEALASAGTLKGAGISYSYMERGHWFWVINFAGTTYSWVYDVTESEITGQPQWHQRARYTAGAFAPYRPWFHTFIPEWGSNGKHIVGDYSSGKLFEMSSDFFDEESTDIRMRRTMSHIYEGGKRIFMSRVEIEHEAGMSWAAGASTPTMTLDWSDDRGHTFGTPRTLSTGAAGAYTARAFATPLGSSRDRVLRLHVQGQAKVAIIDANAEIEVGQH